MRRLRLADRTGAGPRTRPAAGAGEHDHAPAASGLARRRRKRPNASSPRWSGSAIAWFRSTPPRWPRPTTAPGGCCCARSRSPGSPPANVMINLGRRLGRLYRGHGAGDAHPAVLGVGADRHAGDRLCGNARSSARRWAALRADRTNMDVPISLGVLLVTAHEPVADHRRGNAHLFQLRRHPAVLPADRPGAGPPRPRPGARRPPSNCWPCAPPTSPCCSPTAARCARAQESVPPGARVLVGMGERIGVDGVVEHGSAPLDASLVTGESLPVQAGPGTQVFAGTLNQGETLTHARHRHRRRHAAGRVRPADRGRRGAARPVRRAGRPRRAPLRAGGASLRRRHFPVVVGRAGRAARGCAADRLRRADHHLPLRAGAGGAGGAGHRHRRACSAPASC